MLYNYIEHVFYYHLEGCHILEDFINALKSKNKQPLQSKNWKNWIAQKDLKLCEDCSKRHGKIFPISEFVPPMHLFCRCVLTPLPAIASGYATNDSTAGADYWLKEYGRLPNAYITKEEAKQFGWESKKGNLATVAPGKVIGGDRYFNDDGHLPTAAGRIWYEADINYSGGHRGNDRILYSNDGLVFVTYNHYESFIEVI